jgi:hypothetical protein
VMAESTVPHFGHKFISNSMKVMGINISLKSEHIPQH